MPQRIFINIHHVPHGDRFVIWFYGRHITEHSVTMRPRSFSHTAELVHEDIRKMLGSLGRFAGESNVHFEVERQKLVIHLANHVRANHGFALMLDDLIKRWVADSDSCEVSVQICEVESEKELAVSPFDDTAHEAVHRRTDDFFPVGGRGSEREPAFAMGSSVSGY